MTRIQSVLLAVALGGSAAQAAVVSVGDSSAPWLGYMNVFNLPAPAGDGAFQFGSPWGLPDLNSSFDNANRKLTLSPNTIGDPNPYWYTPSGGPGSQGNKIMDANLYIETTDVLNGQTVTFQGMVLTNTFTSAHSATIFIKDFAPDYSSSTVARIPVVPGPFSVSLATDPGMGRHVQYGFEVMGVNVWFTDVAPFGNAMIGTIPTPGSLALLGLSGLVATRRRRA